MDSDKSFVVLIISEDRVCLDIIGSVLSPYYKVKTADSNTEATHLLKDGVIDLIILDYSFYKEDCYNFLANIKSSEETMKVPVILLGDIHKPEYEEHGFNLGAADYIFKPFRSSIIKIRVNNQRRLIKHIKAIEELGMLDTLTSIYNRRGFNNRLHLEWLKAIRDRTNISLAVADVDHFKLYNDEYGHIQGDALLRALAKQFVSMLKKSADFVGRWGGEEFAIVLPCKDAEESFAHIEEIRKSVQEMSVPNLPLATISIGLATTIPSADSSIEAFFSKADKALYKAKNTGRNRVCVFTQ